MSFEGEFASYEPLRRLLDSAKVKALQNRLKIRTPNEDAEDTEGSIIQKVDHHEIVVLLGRCRRPVLGQFLRCLGASRHIRHRPEPLQLAIPRPSLEVFPIRRVNAA